MIGDYSIESENSAIFLNSIPLLTSSPKRYTSYRHAVQLLLGFSYVLHDVIDEYLCLSRGLNHLHHVSIVVSGESKEHSDVSELTQVNEKASDHAPRHQDRHHSHDCQLVPCDFVHWDAQEEPSRYNIV